MNWVVIKHGLSLYFIIVAAGKASMGNIMLFSLTKTHSHYHALQYYVCGLFCVVYVHDLPQKCSISLHSKWQVLTRQRPLVLLTIQTYLDDPPKMNLTFISTILEMYICTESHLCTIKIFFLMLKVATAGNKSL